MKKQQSLRIKFVISINKLVAIILLITIFSCGQKQAVQSEKKVEIKVDSNLIAKGGDTSIYRISFEDFTLYDNYYYNEHNFKRVLYTTNIKDSSLIYDATYFFDEKGELVLDSSDFIYPNIHAYNINEDDNIVLTFLTNKNTTSGKIKYKIVKNSKLFIAPTTTVNENNYTNKIDFEGNKFIINVDNIHEKGYYNVMGFVELKIMIPDSKSKGKRWSESTSYFNICLIKE
jgi:hypothetical protein